MMLNELPTSISETRWAVQSSGSNNIKVYKVDKNTGEIIESFTDMHCIEIIQDDQNPTTKAYLRIYKYGQHANPTYTDYTTDYNSET